MYCRNCGKEIKNDASFCPYCGEPVDNNVAGSNNQQQAGHNTQTETPDYAYQSSSNGQTPKNNHRGRIIAGCIAAVVVVFIAAGLISSSSNRGNPEARSNVLMSDEKSHNSSDAASTWAELPVFGSDNYSRNSILEITFLDDLSNAPNDAWDASEDENGSVKAWVQSNTSGLYDLYIAGNGGVYANPDCSSLFEGYTKLETINFNDCFYTDNVTTMEHMFMISGLTYLDLSSWNTSNVTDMSGMFNQCTSLEQLNVNGWDTSNVTTTYGMFGYCSSLTSVNLSGWDTSNVTTMAAMFTYCSSLTSVNLSGWDFPKGADTTGMFHDCSNLTTIYGFDG